MRLGGLDGVERIDGAATVASGRGEVLLSVGVPAPAVQSVAAGRLQPAPPGAVSDGGTGAG